MALRLHNSLAKQVQPVIPINPERVTFYTCGPTIYDDAHIGNFRSFLAADLLRRWIESELCSIISAEGIEHCGPRIVVHVMNITDVGHMTDDGVADGGGVDKMETAAKRLIEAKKSGKLPVGADLDPNDPYAVAAFYTERFVEDSVALGLKIVAQAQDDPTLMPKATDNIGGMISMIERLIERDHAYVVGKGGSRIVYFDIQSFPLYGRLSGNTLDRLKEGAGGRISDSNQAQKRHPADFLLWKEDSAHLMKWASPWGEGYPGWHIECSVMSYNRLGDPTRADADGLFPDGEALIDIHSGGEDNIFPHHECELAQSCCAMNAEPTAGCFATTWFHPRFLLVEGEKMSKSKGNFFTARDLFEKGHEPAAVRFELIKTHYRSNANFTEQGLKDSARILERWRRFVGAGEASSQAGEMNEEVSAAFTTAMDDDLNIAGALGEMNKWISQTGEPTRADAQLMKIFDQVLGLLELERPASCRTEIGVFAPGIAPDPKVIEILERRAAARGSRDFAAADAARDEVLGLGYAIKDLPGGKVEVSRA